jgi:hypothetical protein
MKWWQAHVEPFFDMPIDEACSLHGYAVRVKHPPTRFRYGCPGNPRGINTDEPNFQSVGVIFRRCARG